MCAGYGLPHETFTWAIRTEPGVVGAFETVYETQDLIVSFDAVNMSFPNRADLPPNSSFGLLSHNFHRLRLPLSPLLPQTLRRERQRGPPT